MNQVEQKQGYDSDNSDAEAPFTDAETPLNNLVEIFLLQDDEYSQVLQEVLAARGDKPKPSPYNLRSSAGVEKPSAKPDNQQR